jgi:hypothetical protein
MSMVYHALQIYGVCARDTVAAVRRSPWAVAFLIAAFAAQYLAGVALAPLGMAGSLLLGFLQAFLVGWYLALVRHALLHKRSLSLQDVRDRAGALFRETLSILFLFSIATLLLGTASPMLPLVAVPVAGIAFNAAPEVIAQGRSVGLEALGDAWEFLRENWPEWLAAQAVVVAVFAGVHALLFHGFDPFSVIAALQLFGPWFGFFDLPRWGAAWLGPALGWLPAIAFALTAHAVVVFRGFLFQHLSSGSRRARAFRARAAGR